MLVCWYASGYVAGDDKRPSRDTQVEARPAATALRNDSAEYRSALHTRCVSAIADAATPFASHCQTLVRPPARLPVSEATRPRTATRRARVACDERLQRVRLVELRVSVPPVVLGLMLMVEIVFLPPTTLLCSHTVVGGGHVRLARRSRF